MRRDAQFLICLILILWLPYYMGAFDKDKPASSTSLRSSNPEILANWSAVQSAVNQDHEFAGTASGTQSGKHEVIVFQEEASAGASATNEGHLQAIDGGSQPELAFTSEDGTEVQLTKDGNLHSSNNIVVDGTSTLTGNIISNLTLAAGFDLIGSATSDINMNSGNFTVAGATGNTSVGGTFESVGVATLADTSVTKTTAAPVANAQITNKKYVDDLFVYAKMRRNTIQSINSGSETVVEFNAEVFESSAGINNTGTFRITPGVAGKYILSASIKMAIIPDQKFVLFKIRVSGSTIAQVQQKQSTATTGDMVMNITTIVDLTAANYIDCTVEHDSGTAKDVSSGEAATFMAVAKIGHD